VSTAIPYLTEVWNVTTGCSPISVGCDHCYAERMTHRNLPHLTAGHGFTPTFHADRLEQPLHWRKPRVVGVSFMGDLFHEAITDEQILSVFDVVRRDWNRSLEGQTPHTFLVLTKRPGRMHDIALRARLDSPGTRGMYLDDNASDHTGYPILGHHGASGLPNLWLGTTVCNQAEAGRNIPLLLDTPAAVRWVSIEPMLGAVDLRRPWPDRLVTGSQIYYPWMIQQLDWVVLGGETGPGARPMEPKWALDVYRQCKAAGVLFYWKQWGDGVKTYGKKSGRDPGGANWASLLHDHGLTFEECHEVVEMETTREFPAVSS